MPQTPVSSPHPHTTLQLGPLRIHLQTLAQQATYACLLLLPSLGIAYLFNPLLYHLQGGEWVVGFLLSACGLALGVFILHILRRAGLVLAPFVALLLFSFTHITATYNVEPGPSFIGAVMETTVEETVGMLTPSLVAAGLAAVVAYTLFVRWSRRFFSPWNIFLAGLFLVHLLFAQGRMFTGNASRYMRSASRWSMDYVSDPIKYSVDFLFEDREKVEELRALKDPAASPSSRDEKEPLVVVLIVGESLRADHLAINGYSRDTTPLLAKEDLVNFRRVQSYAAWTRESIIGIFTDNGGYKKPITCGSFVKLFQKHNFAVATYNANTKPNRSDFSATVLTEGAKRFFASRPDANLLEIFRQNWDKGPLELHIVSPYGSHFPYREGYSEDFARFQPDNYKRPNIGDDIPALVNSYDNTVLYTDHITARFIDAIRSKNSVLIYVSDHGESLGEEGRFVHGANDAPEQRHVPLFFWFSDSYKQRHPDIIARLREKTEQPVTHSHLFHTLLGIAGIETPVRDPKRDLTQ